MAHDVIIIGAGAGGLSAAISNAAAGRSVLVVEAAEEAGGKIGRAMVDGVEFDTGPSVLTMTDVLDDLLRVAGTSLNDEVELVEASPAIRYHYPDGVSLDVYGDVERTLAEVGGTLGSTAQAEFAAFLDYAAGIWDAAAPNFVYGEAPSVGGILRGGLGSMRAIMKIDPMRSMWSGITGRVSSRHLQWLFARYATYNGSDPRRAPATLNCIAHVELVGGGYGIRGGMYELVRALERVARSQGVEFCFGEAVRQIVVRGGQVVGIETDRGFEAASAVVCNADVAHLVGTLLDSPPSDIAPPEELSMSGWTALVRARRRSDDSRCAHEVVFPEDYLTEFSDIFDGRRPPEDPTVYFCAQERAHARVGWDEDEPLFVMANAPPEPEGHRRRGDVWENLRERVLERLRAYDAIDHDDAIVWQRTPAVLASRFPGSRGAIYGAASNSHFAAFRRPPNDVSELPGLYLASGTAHPGGGVPLALLSGMLASKAVDRQTVRTAPSRPTTTLTS